MPDWFNGPGGFNGNLDNRPFRAVQGLARNGATGSSFAYQPGGPNLGFGLYENAYDLRALGLSVKWIARLSFTKPAGSSTVGIFAVSAFQAAPQLQNPRLGTGGRLEFDLIHLSGRRCGIESSDDLKSWQLEFEIKDDAEMTGVSIPLTIGKSERIYRAIAE